MVDQEVHGGGKKGVHCCATGGHADDARIRDDPDAVCTVQYGHLGDGNIHLNVWAPDHDERVLGAIEPFIYERIAALGGSISAEHGLGQMKAGKLGFSKPPAAVHVMKQMKALLDPKGILNPYKVLPGDDSRVEGGSVEER